MALGGWGEAAGPTRQERLEVGWGSGRLGLPGLGRDGMTPGHWLEAGEALSWDGVPFLGWGPRTMGNVRFPWARAPKGGTKAVFH